jgi:hypothetical protein
MTQPLTERIQGELFKLEEAEKQYDSMDLQQQMNLILEFKKANSDKARATRMALISFLAFKNAEKINEYS